jgi:hypothetical protein
VETTTTTTIPDDNNDEVQTQNGKVRKKKMQDTTNFKKNGFSHSDKKKPVLGYIICFCFEHLG